MTRDPHRPLREAWIVEAVRTPIGRYGGALASVRPDDLAALAIRARRRSIGHRPGARSRTSSSAARTRPARTTATSPGWPLLLAGLPVEVGGQTVNRLCGSGLQAINSAAHAIAVGDGDVFIGGGVESMTRAPYVMAKAERRLGPRATRAPGHDARLAVHQPEAGRDALPVLDGRDRRERRRALDRSTRASARTRSRSGPPASRRGDRGRPVRRPDRAGRGAAEEGRRRRRRPRRAPPRRHLDGGAGASSGRRSGEGGSVTAGNSSGINDGASAVLLVEARAGARARAPSRWRASSSTAVAGVDPAIMGIGPVPATRKALERAGIGVDDLDLDRAQRGVRLAVGRLHRRARPRSRPRSTSTAARSRSGIRSG